MRQRIQTVTSVEKESNDVIIGREKGTRMSFAAVVPFGRRN